MEEELAMMQPVQKGGLMMRRQHVITIYDQREMVLMLRLGGLIVSASD
jgi:hypothetical protein